MKKAYGIDLVVFVGDRGMVTQTQIDRFVEQGGVEWITALKSGSIRTLKTEGRLQLSLFDDKGVFEFKSNHYPDERLVACRNPDLAQRRAKKRKSLIDATKTELDKLQARVYAGRLSGKAEIRLQVGRVINKYKVAKHFKVEIEDNALVYRVRRDSVAAEASVDGIYISARACPRTSSPPKTRSAITRYPVALARVANE